MADEIKMTVDTRGFQAKLDSLDAKIANKYMRTAMQAAGDVILPVMKAHAPERTDDITPDGNSLPPGILKLDLTTQVALDKNGSHLKVGPTAVAAHVCRWQNNGWTLTTHKGRKVRQIPGKHFMEAAVDETANEAVNAFAESLKRSLNTDGSGTS